MTMRKFSAVLLTVVMLFTFMLSACSDDKDTDTGKVGDTDSTVQEDTTEEKSSLQKTDDEASSSELTDADIESIKLVFAETNKIYSYFNGSAKDMYTNAEKEIDGVKYYACAPAASFEVLKEMCLNYMSAEKYEELVSFKAGDGSPLYVEQDGVLYRLGGFVGTHAYDEPVVEFTAFSLDRFGNVNVQTIIKFDENELQVPHAYTCARNENGVFVFSDSFVQPLNVVSAKQDSENKPTDAEIADIKEVFENTQQAYACLLGALTGDNLYGFLTGDLVAFSEDTNAIKYQQCVVASTIEELKNDLGLFMSAEKLDEFIGRKGNEDEPYYVEKDGKLYLWSLVGQYGYDAVKVEFTDFYEDENGNIYVEVSINFVEHNLTVPYTYVCQRTDNGSFKFGDDFVLPLHAASAHFEQ